MPSADELKNSKHAFKEVMGAWAASELILGVHSSAQVQRDNVTGVRPFRKFMAWGHAMMDSSAFAAATRSMGLSALGDGVQELQAQFLTILASLDGLRRE